MTDVNPVSTPPSIVERVKAILLKPREEWPRIEAEPASIGSILTGYAMLLAAIPPLASLIGGQIFGFGAFGITYRPSLVGAVGMAITHYVLSLVGLFIMALIIDFLAPRFGGQQNRVQAFKVAAYSATAGWVAGIFSLVPALSVLGILGLYSLYLLYLGLPRIMKAPEDKALGYTIVTVLAAALLFVVAGAVTASFSSLFSHRDSLEQLGGEMTVPGVGKVDMGKLEAASKQMEQAAKKMEDAAKTGQSAAVAPSALQALLPEQVGRFTRTEVESSGMSAGSRASARYSAGDDTLSLEITDMSAAGAFAGLGAALNVQSNRETATGYEKTETVDGRIVSESWDKESRDGKFSTTLANRFMVEARGTVSDINELKEAVNAIPLDQLAAMAK